VKEVNKELIHHKIHGGKDLSIDFPELGNTTLYCITEIHSIDEIEALTMALKEILS
jgi:glycine dehydrogenase subunit 1